MSEPAPPQMPDLNAMFGELFSQFFSGRTVHVSATLAITDEEAAAGVTKAIQFKRAVQCTTCTGRGTSDADAAATTCAACGGAGKRTHTQGFFQVQTTCAACKGIGIDTANRCARCEGHGTTVEPASMTVVVPAGVQHEHELLFAGKGAARRDGTTGDLRVRLLVGGRPDSRLGAMENVPPELASMFAAPLPAARIHRTSKRSISPLVVIGAVLVLLVVLAAFLR